MRLALPTVITHARWTALTLQLPIAALLLWAGFTNPLAMADCQSQAAEARLLLDTTIQQANRNAHPNPDAFATNFEQAVKQLQQNKCMPELMGLIQHIQNEQQKLPAMAETKPSPMPPATPSAMQSPTEESAAQEESPKESQKETAH